MNKWMGNSLTGLTIGERLKILRERKGITQKELGRLMGISGMTIYRIEIGGELNIEKLIQLSEIFRVSLNYLVYGTNDDPSYVMKSDD